MALRLIIEDDEGQTDFIPLRGDVITIGREQGNTIQLTEKNVSRRHARLVPQDSGWVLEDLGSYNGIKVNGHPIEGRVLLQEGDVAQIGDYHLALSEEADRRTVNVDGPPLLAANTVDVERTSASSELPVMGPDELDDDDDDLSGVADEEPNLQVAPEMPILGGKRRSTGAVAVISLLVVAVVAGGTYVIVSDGLAPSSPDQVAAREQREQRGAHRDVAPPERTWMAQTNVEAPVKEADPIPPAPPEPLPASGSDSDRAAGSSSAGVGAGAGAAEPIPAAATTSQATRQQKKSRRRRRGKRDESSRLPDRNAGEASSAEAQAIPESLYQDAKTELYRNKNYARAYEIAEQAWNRARSPRAAALMATAACKMGDADKARSAVGKLRGQKREQAIKVCELYQVEI